MTLGKRFRFLRLSRSLSQRELGSRIGKTQQQIHLYETDQIGFPAALLPKLAEALDVSTSAFFEEFVLEAVSGSKSENVQESLSAN